MEKAVIELANRKIRDLHPEIRNLYFHSRRIWLEKACYYFRTLLYGGKR